MATRMLSLASLFFLSLAVSGQYPTYENRLINDTMPDPYTYEFDIYLLRTGSIPLELVSYTAGIYFDPVVVNGGTITASIVPGSSQLFPAQQPTIVTIGNGSNGTFCLAGLPYYIIRLAGVSPPGAGNGTYIVTDFPGTRVCRIKLTNSLAFAPAPPIQCFNFQATPYNTVVRAYVGGLNTNITIQAFHFITDLTNPLLNLPVPVHTLTGGGIAPAIVGLDGSDAGIRYWLYRDGVSTQWPTTGTGSPFTFNGSPFSSSGVYTSTGWRKATYLTAAMNGPVTIDKNLHVKCFLEGLYAGGSAMNAVSDGSNYVFGPTIADTFHIELKDQTDYHLVFKSPSTNLHTDGTSQVVISHQLSDSYYLVVKHRNSIETWSKFPIPFSGGIINYDFSLAAEKAFGDNMKQLAPGEFGIFTGDVNQDGAVDPNDLGDIDNDSSGFTFGYVVTDLNGDAVVDSNDMGLADNNVSGFVIVVRP